MINAVFSSVKPIHIREFPLGHELFGQGRLEAVESQYDQPVDLAVFIGPLAPQHPPEEAERPGDKRKNGQDEGQEEDQERGQERESGARPDVGLEGHGEENSQDGGAEE